MIRLTVTQTDNVNLSINQQTSIPISVEGYQTQRVLPDVYTGAYEVTPSAEVQTLQTSDLVMLHNVTINPIPSNYGLITWNGLGIRVS